MRTRVGLLALLVALSQGGLARGETPALTGEEFHKLAPAQGARRVFGQIADQVVATQPLGEAPSLALRWQAFTTKPHATVATAEAGLCEFQFLTVEFLPTANVVRNSAGQSDSESDYPVQAAKVSAENRYVSRLRTTSRSRDAYLSDVENCPRTSTDEWFASGSPHEAEVALTAVRALDKGLLTSSNLPFQAACDPICDRPTDQLRALRRLVYRDARVRPLNAFGSAQTVTISGESPKGLYSLAIDWDGEKIIKAEVTFRHPAVH